MFQRLLQRLKLVAPARQSPSASSKASAGAIVCPCSPQVNPEVVKEIERRKGLILKSGQVPKWLFSCGSTSGMLVIRQGADQKTVTLLFTTPYAAQDYIRATNTPNRVMQLRFDALPGSIASAWIAAGVNFFALNRCPRCNVTILFPIEVMKDKDRLVLLWAICRATQLCRGEIMVREFMQCLKTSPSRARVVLETIRDHIDCGIPYLHELIAFTAHLDQNEAAKAEAIERLREFGPQFANWGAKWDTSPGGSSSLGRSVAEAMLGLTRSFGIELKSPPSSVI